MAYAYGYGELEDQLIDLFQSGAPDFEAAEKLIQQGADLNAEGKEEDENILSEILMGYWQTSQDDELGINACDDCGQNINLNRNFGESMCEIIRFFLVHGFDVAKNDGCYGAQCLYALTLSSFDRSMIEATKILLDAGAKNQPISMDAQNCDETPWDFIATEGSFQGSAEHDYAQSNLYEAVYQIYQALEDGKPYDGIDSYELAIGRRILKVVAESHEKKEIFHTISLSEFKKDNCFNQNLYFVYDGGVLISTQYGDSWTDTRLPDVELVDVSKRFEEIVGATIQNFTFEHREIRKGTTCYGQPITTIEMDSGKKLRFSINFGEVQEKDRAAFYEIIP